MSSFFYINNSKYIYIYRTQMVERKQLPSRTWKFPLERENDYKGTITFRPIKYTPPEVGINSLSDLLTRRAGNGFLNQFLNDESVIGAFSEGFQAGRGAEEITATLNPTPTDTETFVSPSTNVVDRSKGVILYLPSSILVNDAIGYENFDLGAIGAIGLAGVRAGQGAPNALARGVGQAFGSLADLLSGNVADQRGARLAASRLAEAGGTVASGVVRSGFSTIVNPNTINLFRNVQLREFQFTFKLIANSAREAEEIENIIKFFRASMYPDTINFDPDGLNVPIGYEFPDKFQIEMRYNGEQVGLRILNSVLRAFQTNYNPQSMVWHKDGKPTEVEIQLGFGEERTLNRNDILDGY
jgi:hypothetical protein